MTTGKLRVLERMAQAAQECLARTPEVPAVPRRSEASPLPSGLAAVVERLALLEDALSRSGVNAAGVENLLQTEADALGSWVEILIRVKARLNAWADEGAEPT
jgi:hypothetical protein